MSIYAHRRQTAFEQHTSPPGFSASSLRKLSSSSELRCSISTRASTASGSSPITQDGNLYQQVRASTEGCAGRRAPPSKTYLGCGPVLQNPDINRAPLVVELVRSQCADGCAPSSDNLSSEFPSDRRVERRPSPSGFVPRVGAPDVAVDPGSTILNASASGRHADFPGSRGSGVSGT